MIDPQREDGIGFTLSNAELRLPIDHRALILVGKPRIAPNELRQRIWPADSD